MQWFVVKASGAAALLSLLTAGPVAATPFTFSTGSPDGLMASASRPDTGVPFEIESADDFTLTSSTLITSATFTGLVTGASPTLGKVVVEIYKVFPNLSGCWSDRRGAHFLDVERPDAGQLAVGCRARRS